ncbi:MAG TPA: cupin domain-containing protein [Pirellulaceae bacterium]
MKIRRIVTGRDGAGKSCFVADGAPPKAHDFVHIPGMHVSRLWATDPLPVLPGKFGDPTVTQTSIVPRQGGTQLLILTLPPDSVMQGAGFDPVAAGAENMAQVPGLAELFEQDCPGMHTTDTVDYGIVLEGEVSLELDDGRVVQLRKHDVVVQNGTRHAWRNPGRSPATMAFVLIGAKRQA